MSSKKVLVVIVNYNGIRFLETCFNSLENQTFTDFDVLLVDNRSVDQSVEYIRKNYPQTIIYEAKVNYGFAEGNNIGFRHALRHGYTYVALLNNDAVAEPNWLEDLVAKAEQGVGIGAVSSKLVFWTKFLKVTFKSQAQSPLELGLSNDTRYLSVCVESTPILSETKYMKSLFGSGWWPPEGGYRWSSGLSTCLLPIENENVDAAGIFIIVRAKSLVPNTRVDVFVNEQNIGNFMPFSDDFSTFAIPVPNDTCKQAVKYVVNNFGSYVDVMGYGHDVGFGCEDSNELRSYSADAFCGANVLIPTNVVREVGVFDHRYFMYYEDVELSLRIRSRGYQILISADSKVRHYHSGSSVHNPVVHFFMERNRLITLMRYGTLRQGLWVIRNTLTRFLREFTRLGTSLVFLRRGVRSHLGSLKFAARLLGSLVMETGRLARFRNTGGVSNKSTLRF